MRIVECRPYVAGYGVRIRVALEWGGTSYSHWHSRSRVLVRCYVQDQTIPGGAWMEIVGPDGSAYSECGPSPDMSDDGDAAVDLAISCLSIRPGDTDAEYFADYTPEMLEFCTAHGESLYTDWESRREWPEDAYRSDHWREDAESGEVVYRLPWLDVTGDDPTDTTAAVVQLGSDGEEWPA